MFQGLCINYIKPGNEGSISFFHDISISTSFLRQFSSTSTCADGEPCHVYITIPQYSSDFFINYHITTNTCGESSCLPAVYFRKVTENEDYEFEDLTLAE